MKRFLIKTYNKIKPYLTWKMFPAFLLAWLITNGYIYILIGYGIATGNDTLKTLGFTILGIYWLPFFVERPPD